jgi:hypothetical protein
MGRPSVENKNTSQNQFPQHCARISAFGFKFIQSWLGHECEFGVRNVVNAGGTRDVSELKVQCAIRDRSRLEWCDWSVRSWPKQFNLV